MNQEVEALIKNMQRVIIGEKENLQYLVVALLCEGHVLLEGLPGVGKTKLALALSKSTQGIFKRVQFTPDVLPSDITGYYLYNRVAGEMEYKEGAALCNFLLADEINRASPRVQSSLLEVMEERQVTVEGHTMQIPSPFMVIATQNAIENEGTYPLPEAQLDRFFMKLYITYPKRKDWRQIIDCYEMEDPMENLEVVMTGRVLMALKEEVRNVVVTDKLKEYVLDVIETVSRHEAVKIGINPRGSLALIKGARAWAFLSGRDYVLPDDVQQIIVPIIGHRIKLKSGYESGPSHIERVLIESIRKVQTMV